MLSNQIISVKYILVLNIRRGNHQYYHEIHWAFKPVLDDSFHGKISNSKSFQFSLHPS